MLKEIGKTPLHQWHVAHGANMADFAGYNMPIWYPTCAGKEHLAVLESAGIFDTSHMSIIILKGPDALALLQLCFTRNLKACWGKQKSALAPGESVYGVFLNEAGNVIDDAILYCLSSNHFMVVVNSGMGGKVARHLTRHIGMRRVDVFDMSDKIGKIDLQGPAAAKILKKLLLNPEKIFEKMSFFTFKGRLDQIASRAGNVFIAQNIPIILSRTGYTGEFGFEIFIENDHLLKVWEMLLGAGNEFKIVPCGLAARDSLRTGAVLPLSHQDIGPWPFINNPWTFVLPYNSQRNGFNKKFIGDDALLNADKPDHTSIYVGFDLRKVSTQNSSQVLDSAGNHIGVVLTCVTDTAIGIYKDRIFSVFSSDKPDNFILKGLCCGFVRTNRKLVPGQIVVIKDNRRKLKVMIVNDIRPNRTARCHIKDMI